MYLEAIHLLFIFEGEGKHTRNHEKKFKKKKNALVCNKIVTSSIE